MKVTQLTVANREFYIKPEEAEQVLAAAVVARNTSAWLEFTTAGGRHVRLLIPAEALMVVVEYDVDDDPDPGSDPSDWDSFHSDLTEHFDL